LSITIVTASVSSWAVTTTAATTPSPPAATPSAPMTEGEIRKVDKENRKITIRHGEIKNLDMPAMTMVFQVRDPALLENVKAGDRIRFTADKVMGAFTVLSIEPER
jgi:Cu(I)/Ag(I) efflux system protein CusF